MSHTSDVRQNLNHDDAHVMHTRLDDSILSYWGSRIEGGLKASNFGKLSVRCDNYSRGCSADRFYGDYVVGYWFGLRFSYGSCEDDVAMLFLYGVEFTGVLLGVFRILGWVLECLIF